MRKLKKAASCLLAASVVLTGTVLFQPVHSLAEGTGDRLVIFDADPDKAGISDGGSAEHPDITWNGWNEATGESVVKKDESTPYYRVTISDNSYTGLATIQTGMNSADNLRVNAWTVNASMLQAIAPYVRAEFDVRWNGSELAGEKLYIVPASTEYAMSNVDGGTSGAFVKGLDLSDVPAGQWVTCSVDIDSFFEGNWWERALAVGVWNGSGDMLTAPIELDIRRFRLTVSSEDKTAIHNALKDIDGITTLQWFITDWDGSSTNSWLTEDGLQMAEGVYNYFEVLTTYNKRSSYKVSNSSHTVTNSTAASNGSIAISAANAKPGETVIVTASPVESYCVDTITVTYEDGLVYVNRGTDTTYTFVMPDGNVSVTATFKASAAVPPTFSPSVQVTKRTSDSLTLEWTAAKDAAGEEITYKVYASTEPFDGTVSGEPKLITTGTTATITGLEAETAYYLAITAANAAGGTAVWSSENSVSTTAENTSEGQLTITAEVGVAYTLSIPTSMGTITAAGDHEAGTLYASRLTLGENDKLTVTAEHEEVLTHTNGINTLAYALKSASHGGDEKTAYQPVEFTKDSTVGEEGGVDLYVSITEEDWNEAAAGTYTDTVTFAVAYTEG